MDISHIKLKKAYKILSEYQGNNPYIIGLKQTKNINLTGTQAEYLVMNENTQPIFMDKVVEIDEFLGNDIKKRDGLDFIPNKIKIECLLGETSKAYHIIGKTTTKAKPKMYFLGKNNVFDDLTFSPLPVDIDFAKYNERLMERRGYHLLPHQEEGVKFLLERNGAILADAPGVAKTLTAIVAALHTKYKRVLIVCPSSLKINWQRELNTFTDNTTIVEGRIWTQARFTIINPDILQNFHTLDSKVDPNDPPMYLSRELVNAKFDLIIIDEAHLLRNKNSIRGEIVSELATKFGNPKVWLLTGTPVANRPKDYYNLLKLIRCKVADDFPFYMRRYCDGKMINKKLANGKTKQIWMTNGSSNLEELAKRTKHLTLRRLKEDVLDMPEKQIIRQYQRLSESSRKEYDLVWEEYLAKRKEEKKKGNIERELVELGLLRKFIAMEAVKSTYEMAMNIVDSGEKVIIFTTFNEEQDELAELFGDIAVRHNGSMSITDKQASVDAFQKNDKIKVFLGNVISAGVGITLTAATTTIFNSYSWIPGDNSQAEDRCIFGGQKVLTSDGYKLIEDIVVGDNVYTHNGNFKRVVDKHSHLERKKLKYSINAFGCNENLDVTQDHEIFVYNSETNGFEWVEAQNIDILKHSLTFKQMENTDTSRKTIYLENYETDVFINSFNKEQKNGRLLTFDENKEIDLTPELMYAFGFYVAEGWSTNSNKKGNTVNVCQKITNKKMYDASEYIIKIFVDSFGLDTYGTYVDKGGCKTNIIYSKNLAKNFIEWFGKNAHNKTIPDWMFECDKELINSFIDGFNHGDGHNRKNEQSNVTASPKLMSKLMLLMTKVGLSPTITYISDETDLTKYYKSSVFNGVRSLIKSVDGYSIYPIKDIKISRPKRGFDRVYDLSVEDDHSFVVGNYNVHNCWRLGQKNRCICYYIIFEDTISEKVMNTLDMKTNVINQIIGTESEAKIMGERIMDLVLK